MHCVNAISLHQPFFNFYFVFSVGEGNYLFTLNFLLVYFNLFSFPNLLCNFRFNIVKKTYVEKKMFTEAFSETPINIKKKDDSSKMQKRINN